jgi:hypothetical protein
MRTVIVKGGQNQRHITRSPVCGVFIIYLLLVLSPWASLAGTRAQSGDRYGSGTLHPGQVLRGSLPLLSPDVFICMYIFVCIYI